MNCSVHSSSGFPGSAALASDDPKSLCDVGFPDHIYEICSRLDFETMKNLLKSNSHLSSFVSTIRFQNLIYDKWSRTTKSIPVFFGSYEKNALITFLRIYKTDMVKSIAFTCKKKISQFLLPCNYMAFYLNDYVGSPTYKEISTWQIEPLKAHDFTEFYLIEKYWDSFHKIILSNKMLSYPGSAALAGFSQENPNDLDIDNTYIKHEKYLGDCDTNSNYWDIFDFDTSYNKYHEDDDFVVYPK